MSRKIIFVEDDDLFRESLIDSLSLSGHEIEGVSSGVEFRQKIGQGDYGVAIIDIGLPDISGFELADETRETTSTKIIFLTARESIDDRLSGYQAGGHIYFTKPVDTRELSAAINSLLRQDRFSTKTQGHWTLDLNQWILSNPQNKKVKLTANEVKFLKILASAHGELADRNRLLERIYPRIDSYTSRALDALVRRLRKKLEEICEQELPFKTSYSQGYIFTEPIYILG